MTEGDNFALGSQEGPDVGIPLRDQKWLRLAMRLYVAPKKEKSYLKITSSNYQYQLDREEKGNRWIFRYEYFRSAPNNKHPAAHLHVNGTLAHDPLPKKKTLARVHFPTGRVSIESVIRLLHFHFAVPCNEAESIWRPVLEQTESAFLEIAHKPRP